MTDNVSTIRLRMALNAALFCLFAYAVWEARNFVPITARLPTGIGVAGMAATSISIAIDAVMWRKRRTLTPAEQPAVAGDPDHEPAVATEWEHEGPMGFIGLRAGLKWFGWIFALAGSIFLLGMVGGSWLFLAVFLRREAGGRWRLVVVSGAILALVLTTAAQLVGLRYPDGVVLPALLWLDRLWVMVLG